MGKPLKYKTPEELQQAIEEYFIYCDNRVQQVYSPKAESVIEVINPEPYTMAGLAYALGLSRQALMEYSHKDLYGDAVKRARNRVERDVEVRLMDGKAPAGAIFNLKNNFAWRDQTHVDNTVHLPKPIYGGLSVDPDSRDED